MFQLKCAAVAIFALTASLPAHAQSANGFSEAPAAPEVSVRAMPREGGPPLISASDYPPAALRNGEQGLVRVTLLVGIDGRVAGCAVTVSSGSQTLDEATCSILRRRARFIAAAQANGSPALDRWVYSFNWVLSKP